ncbi:lactate/malate family dehydrogenase [Actinomyces vulturis]|uniref:lactate/malate family dehydrogenase n=1 Tax=Actinomyces vulturis TaxID=1857645 RepID=UPI000AB8FCF2|nr:hypothetical protein [Actinomyces vulturis]
MMKPLKPHKLVIVGVGRVGDAILADAMKMDLFGSIVVIDANDELARGEALDQHHATAMPMLSHVSVSAGTYDDCADADVVISTAGPSLKKDQATGSDADRRLLASVNAAVVRDIMGNIAQRTCDAAVIVVSNPLDMVTHVASTEFDYPANLVMGTGTLLDTARMRRVIADRLGVDPHAVHGDMMGEHGPSGFPYLSGTTVGGVPYEHLKDVFGVTVPSREELSAAVSRAGWDVFNTKGWTSAGVAQAALTVARAILLDEKAILPVASTLRGEYGHDGDVTLSVPTIIGANGIERRLEVPLTDWEREQFDASVRAVQNTIALGTLENGEH